jgi:nucleoside-diphosphate-sugar epimerase
MDELQTREPGYSDVVNLGGGRPLSMNYLLETIRELTGKKVQFNRLETNSNDAKKTMADSNYIQSLIGTKPKIKLEDGIAETIKWAQRKEVSEELDKWVKSVK